jgi:hypothetical protein
LRTWPSADLDVTRSKVPQQRLIYANVGDNFESCTLNYAAKVHHDAASLHTVDKSILQFLRVNSIYGCLHDTSTAASTKRIESPFLVFPYPKYSRRHPSLISPSTSNNRHSRIPPQIHRTRTNMHNKLPLFDHILHLAIPQAPSPHIQLNTDFHRLPRLN